MTPLDAARAMMDRAVTTNEFMGKHGSACHLCSWARVYWDHQPIEHSPDCPVPAMPQIAAALEAASELLRRPYQAPSHGWGTVGWYCVACSAEAPDPDTIAHEPTCPRPTLETLLRGGPS